MYEEFFGLHGSPFELSPDPSFMVLSEKSREALASISYAVSRRKGFLVMTGEVGTGKTLILRCLFDLWEREHVPFAYVIGPRLSTIDFLGYIARELGIPVTEPTKGPLLRALYEFLLAQFEKGLTTVLVIDEAHQVPRTVLEEIRLLANFETAQQKLIQVLLVGQPELDKKLDSIELRSLKQRVAVRCLLEPLREDEIQRYIERRLEVAGAGAQTTTIFPAETVEAIARYSAGIPRLVNNICDQALIAAYGQKIREVPPEIIDEVALRFRLDPAFGIKPAQVRSLEPSAKPVDIPPAQPPEDEPATNAAAQTPANAVHSDSEPVNETPLKGAAAAASALAASPVRETETSMPEVAVPAALSSVPETREPETAAPSPLPGAACEAEAEVVAAAVPEDAQAPAAEPVTEAAREPGLELRYGPMPAARRASELWQQATAPQPSRFRLSHLLDPKLRLVVFGSAVVVAAVALASGVLVARRERGMAIAPVQTTSNTLPAAPLQPDPLQSSGASTAVAGLTVVDATSRATQSAPSSLDAAAPRGPGAAPSAPAAPAAGAAPKAVAPRNPVAVEKLPAPLAKRSNVSSSEPPPVLQASAPLASDGTPPLGLQPGAPVAPNGASRVQPARIISSPQPTYPPAARVQRAQGDVVLDALVNEKGQVSVAEVISGNNLLQQAAINAVQGWRYEPARLNGDPVPSHVRVTITFRLP
jgi:general secretion pathway protein A